VVAAVVYPGLQSHAPAMMIYHGLVVISSWVGRHIINERARARRAMVI